MIPKPSRRAALAITTVIALGLPLLARQSATVAQDAATVPTGCAVVATGLHNPRQIALGPDGAVYVAEAGDAGLEAIYATTGPGTPAPTDPVTMLGATGRVSKIAPDGTQTVLIDGLPSYSFGAEVVGPAGIAVAGETVYVAIGGPGAASARIALAPNANAVVAIDSATGAVTTLADIGTYEKTTNPDPHAIDSNLTGLGVGADGMLSVADAGGNAVYRVDPATGALSLLAVIPGLPTPDGGANPARGGAPEVDPVPTEAYAAPDGGVYVGLLSGANLWGTPGATKIVHLAPDGTIVDAATGLDLVVDVTAGPDGALYATQLSANLFAEPPAPGSVVRIEANGAPEPVIDGLTMPYGIAFDAAGQLYVVTNASVSPGAAPQGQLLRCDLTVTTPTVDAAAEPTPAADAADGAGADLTLELVDIAFQPTEITIPANTDVVIAIVNQGAAPHSFDVDALNVHSGTLESGASDTVTINAAPGTYQFICAVPGHKEAGMVGTLIVE